MFLTYLRRELRQRARQAVLIALGLAVGIGLVLTVTSASAGVKTAQSKVLDSLYGVGTDITVTKTATPGSGGGPTVKFGGGSGSSSHAHDSFSKSSLTSFGYRAVPASDVAKIAKLAHVSSASGALVLTEIAPGARLEQDVLAHMDFRPRISRDLREMDPRIFRPGPMGIGRSFVDLPARRRAIARGTIR